MSVEFPRVIRVACLCPSLDRPGDEFEADSEATYRVDILDGRIVLDLVRFDLWVNGSPVSDDPPQDVQMELERLAMDEARRILMGA